MSLRGAIKWHLSGTSTELSKAHVLKGVQFYFYTPQYTIIHPMFPKLNIFFQILAYCVLFGQNFGPVFLARFLMVSIDTRFVTKIFSTTATLMNYNCSFGFWLPFLIWIISGFTTNTGGIRT